MERLGYLYSVGFGGIGPNAEMAFEWFLKAAMEGAVSAMSTVGHCYLNGAGIGKSDEEAAKWLKMAAENGDSEAEKTLRTLDGSAKDD